MIEISKNIPTTFYKYGSWDNPFQKRILTESEIYFASANQFNDPFDSSLPFVYSKNELTDENILAKLIATSSKKHLSQAELIEEAKEKMKTTDFREKQFWNDAHDRLKDYLISTFGIFSMTKKNSDILMWSHYANSHKGFCIGISKDAIELTTLTQLKNVVYANTFPKRPMFISESDANKYILKLITTKSEHWKYENEVRLISFRPRYALTMPNEFVREIIFGVSMNEEDKKEIIELRNIKYPKAKLFQAELDRTKFKINIRPLTIGNKN